MFFTLHLYCTFLSHNTQRTLTQRHVSQMDPLMNCRSVSKEVKIKGKLNLFKHGFATPANYFQSIAFDLYHSVSPVLKILFKI